VRIGLAYQMYYRRVWSPSGGQRFSGATGCSTTSTTSTSSTRPVRGPYYVLCDVLWTFDMLVIDGLVNLAGWIGLAFSCSIMVRCLHRRRIVNGLGYT